MSLPAPSSVLRSLLGVILIALTAISVEAAASQPSASPTQRANLAAPSPLDSLPASARGEALVEEGVPQLVATLVHSSEQARIGVVFELAPDWHLYWRNPGETGVAPELGLRVAGHRVGEVEWPVPETFREADDLFLTYGYAGRVLLAAKLEEGSADRSVSEASSANTPAVASGIASGVTAEAASEAMATAEIRALVCRTECVPVELSLSLPLRATPDLRARSAIEGLFAEHAARLPLRADALGWQVEASWLDRAPELDAKGSIALSVERCHSGATGAATRSNCEPITASTERVAFLPFESETLEFEREQRVSSPPDRAHVALELAATRLADSDAPRLRGLIAVPTRDGGTQHAEIDVALPNDGTAAPPPMSPNAASGAGAWLHVLLLALLGGFILNGMPCVLPVLAIKVVSVVDLAERDPREVRLHGLAYTAGILGSMLVLAAIVVSLRAAGHAVGWGFQFQEPLFVAGIAALLVTFALNLFGVFEIELGQGRLATVGQDASGLSRSAFEGLLAVVLATPCTAPFLGTAVGFAFASSGFFVAAIFLAIGLGLASPFLVVSFRPSLARFIPRSGAWMLKLRAGLGFCLLGTVLWLLWIVGQSGGTDAVVSLLAALLFLSFLLWLFGQLQPMRSLWLGRAAATGIAALAFGSFNLIEFEPASEAMPKATQSDPNANEAAGAFRAYDEAAIRETLARGVPVFVVFTADWCITCKVNERTVLDRASVRDALAGSGYALFKADWTRRDEVIRARLAEFGRAGVPLYLVYDPADPERPTVLSELLTEQAVLAALRPARAPRPI